MHFDVDALIRVSPVSSDWAAHELSIKRDQLWLRQ